jgi:hypothetical protein
MLRWVGNSLLGLGVVVGGAVGVAMLTGVHLAGVSWLVAVGIAKLTLVASVGLMAGGAVCLRLDYRERGRLAAGDPPGTER